MKIDLSLKIILKNKAVEMLEARIHSAHNAMLEAQLSANGEGKSSAGDKYETSRAMGQIERDIHAKQLDSARKELESIHKADTESLCENVRTGAIVQTEKAIYFFLTGLGLINIQGNDIIFLSINSPLGKILLGKTKNEEIEFNKEKIRILKIV